MNPHTVTVELEDPQSAECLYGSRNRNLEALSRSTGVQVSNRGRLLMLEGSEAQVSFAQTAVAQLYDLVEAGYDLAPDDVIRSVRTLRQNPGVRLKKIYMDTVITTDRGLPIRPKGLAQKQYIETIRSKDLVFGVGPAGTGKTYLAMAMALDAFLKRKVKRIILTRPAVEAGESLGFLPGDLAEKVNPYLRPLYDALFDMVAFEKATRLVERGDVEVAPLAFMRGRTLNDAFVILDEAQNTTREQMKMFLTRLGYNTRTVVTGDVTQVDLPETRKSGLAHAVEILKSVEGIGFTKFTEVDVVRHPLVMAIIRAYDRDLTDEPDVK